MGGMRHRGRGQGIRVLILLGACLALSMLGWGMMIRMPGESYRRALPPLTGEERRLEGELRAHVMMLAGTIGERNVYEHENLGRAARYIETVLESDGYRVGRQRYQVLKRPCDNLEVELSGGARSSEIVIVGAHYDSVMGSPGANDNATGVAALLGLARRFAGVQPARTLRFVAFVNEEPPFFQTDEMGSWVYAKRSRERGEQIVAMLSLETIGYYSDDPGSQHYPVPFGLLYPSTANFVGFVSNAGNGPLVRRLVGAFREAAKFPSEGGALPGFIPGVGWSDHWAFWQERYPAAMVTDTALFRYPHYHTARDRPDQVHYDRLARVTAGLVDVVRGLAMGPQ